LEGDKGGGKTKIPSFTTVSGLSNKSVKKKYQFMTDKQKYCLSDDDLNA
jgi:hypothetical protein